MPLGPQGETPFFCFVIQFLCLLFISWLPCEASKADVLSAPNCRICLSFTALVKGGRGGGRKKGRAWLLPLPSREFPAAELFYLDGNFFLLSLSCLNWHIWLSPPKPINCEPGCNCQSSSNWLQHARWQQHPLEYKYILFTVRVYISEERWGSLIGSHWHLSLSRFRKHSASDKKKKQYKNDTGFRLTASRPELCIWSKSYKK